MTNESGLHVRFATADGPHGVTHDDPAIITLGSFAYDPKADEVVIEVNPHTIIAIGPGREAVAALAHLLSRVEETEQARRGAVMPATEIACPHCGEMVRAARLLNGKDVMLNTDPDNAGVYIYVREGRIRTLRPFETPVGSTYRRHTCRDAGAE